MSRRAVTIAVVVTLLVVGVIAFRHYFSPGEVVNRKLVATLLWREETPGWRFASTPELDIPELREELESRRNRKR